MVTAIAISAVSTVIGLYLSFYLDIASGATIVLVQTAAFLVVLLGRPGVSLLRRPPTASALGDD
jgi:ABC-type Mn2+/Zn2+ transport system permease subunit